MVRGNKEMNIKFQGNLDSLVVNEVATSRSKIEKINKRLSQVDRSMLELTDEYNTLIFEKAKLIDVIEKRKEKDV